ncbi:MAG: hypothetical protein ACLP8S_33255 [Solirubrobacteraceae bacterium]
MERCCTTKQQQAKTVGRDWANGDRRLRVCVSVAAVWATVALAAAGCGSGGSRSSSVAARTAATSSTSPAGALKVDTTPKYAVPSPSSPVQSGVVRIAYRDIAIDPDTVRAQVGSTVRWINEDPEKCNVTSEGGPYKFASPSFGEGGSFELKLTKPGTIHYQCTFYPATMNGTIEALG